jgi:hypothetical protein
MAACSFTIALALYAVSLNDIQAVRLTTHGRAQDVELLNGNSSAASSVTNMNLAVRVYNVEKSNRESLWNNFEALRVAARFLHDSFVQGRVGPGIVDFISVPEATSELLLFLFDLLYQGGNHDKVGVLYQLSNVLDTRFNSWNDLGLALLYNRAKYRAEAMMPCPKCRRTSQGYMPNKAVQRMVLQRMGRNAGKYMKAFYTWLQGGVTIPPLGNTISMAGKQERPMMSGRFRCTSGTIVVVAGHAGHDSHKEDASKINLAISSMILGVPDAPVVVLGDLNAHGGMVSTSAEKKAASLMLEEVKANGGFIANGQIDQLYLDINDLAQPGYTLWPAFASTNTQPVTCCCPPGVPWQRKFNGQACAGHHDERRKQQTLRTQNWQEAFDSGSVWCKKLQGDYNAVASSIARMAPQNKTRRGLTDLPEMPPSLPFGDKGAQMANRCMGSMGFTSVRKRQTNMQYHNYRVPDMDLSYADQFKFDNAIVRTKTGDLAQLLEWAILLPYHGGSDHFPLEFTFQVRTSSPRK